MAQSVAKPTRRNALQHAPNALHENVGLSRRGAASEEGVSAMEKTNVAAELIKSFASVLWPLIVAGALWTFRVELRNLLHRLSYIKKGKLFGQEFELDEKLDQLREATERAEKEIAANPQPLSELKRDEPAEQLEEQLLRDASKSPKVTLMLLAAELDKRIRQLLAASGWQKNIKSGSTLKAIERLRAQGSLPEHVSGSVKLFYEVRSRIIHGGAADDEDILRAIDSGFTLLRAIESVPLESNTVHRTNVPIYSDSKCTQLISDAKAIVLETVSPGGSQKSLRIFPTTRTHFEIGKRVAWEWNLSKTWGPTWYKDLETGECNIAWHSSGEFIGRHLDDL